MFLSGGPGSGPGGHHSHQQDEMNDELSPRPQDVESQAAADGGLAASHAEDPADLLPRPGQDDPGTFMVVHLRGWVDPGSAGRIAMDTIIGQTDPEPVAAFDDDQIIDYRSRRPMMRVVDGVLEKVTWPGAEVALGHDGQGHRVVTVTGDEPDRHWRRFAGSIVDLARSLDVGMMVGLGAFPAPVPHTRPISVVATASNAELAGRVGFQPGQLDVPAGVQAVIEWEMARAGIPAVGLWAPVPHYAANMDQPAGSVALIEALDDLTGLAISTEALAEAAVHTRRTLDALIAEDPQHEMLVKALERHLDSMGSTTDIELPSGDELADEIQRFLDTQN